MLSLIFISCLSGKESFPSVDSSLDSDSSSDVECGIDENNNILLENESEIIVDDYNCTLYDVKKDTVEGVCFSNPDDWYLFVYNYPDLEIQMTYVDSDIDVGGGLFYQNIEKTKDETSLLSIGWNWKEALTFEDGGNDLIDIVTGNRLTRIEDDEIGFPMQGIVSEDYWIISASGGSNSYGVVLLFDIYNVKENIQKEDATVVHYGNLDQGGIRVINEIGDVDGDGFSDFNLYNYNQFGVLLFDDLMNDQGIEQAIYFPTTGSRSFTGVSDWNGDGLDDIAISGDDTNAVSVFDVMNLERIVSYYQTDAPYGALSELYDVENFIKEGETELFIVKDTASGPIYLVISPGECGVNDMGEASVVSWEADTHYDFNSVGAESDFIYFNSFYSDYQEDGVDIFFRKL